MFHDAYLKLVSKNEENLFLSTDYVIIHTYYDDITFYV